MFLVCFLGFAMQACCFLQLAHVFLTSVLQAHVSVPFWRWNQDNQPWHRNYQHKQQTLWLWPLLVSLQQGKDLSLCFGLFPFGEPTPYPSRWPHGSVCSPFDPGTVGVMQAWEFESCLKRMSRNVRSHSSHF